MTPAKQSSCTALSCFLLLPRWLPAAPTSRPSSHHGMCPLCHLCHVPPAQPPVQHQALGALPAMGTHGVSWLFGKLWENMFMPQIRAAPLAVATE